MAMAQVHAASALLLSFMALRFWDELQDCACDVCHDRTRLKIWNHTALMEEAVATEPPLPPAPPDGPASSGVTLSSISSKRSEGSTA